MSAPRRSSIPLSKTFRASDPHMANLRIIFLCLIIASTGAAAAETNVETVARGLQTPWAIAFAPDGRIFVSERPGRIRVIEKGALALAPEPWMRLAGIET